MEVIRRDWASEETGLSEENRNLVDRARTAGNQTLEIAEQYVGDLGFLKTLDESVSSPPDAAASGETDTS